MPACLISCYFFFFGISTLELREVLQRRVCLCLHNCRVSSKNHRNPLHNDVRSRLKRTAKKSRCYRESRSKPAERSNKCYTVIDHTPHFFNRGCLLAALFTSWQISTLNFKLVLHGLSSRPAPTVVADISTRGVAETLMDTRLFRTLPDKSPPSKSG